MKKEKKKKKRKKKHRKISKKKKKYIKISEIYRKQTVRERQRSDFVGGKVQEPTGGAVEAEAVDVGREEAIRNSDRRRHLAVSRERCDH